MTSRARLLAILKERPRFAASVSEPWAVIDYTTGVETMHADLEASRTSAADLNARHRLKRLCEEIAEMHVMLGIQPPETGPFTRENKALEQFRATILALGEDNEHS
jgi:hypothetical protein